YGNCV
ncbi:hypothetical protein ACTFIU_008855, partial [Dictyostelium citrinum]